MEYEIGLFELGFIFVGAVILGVIIATAMSAVYRAVERRRARRLTPLIGVVLPREDSKDAS